MIGLALTLPTQYMISSNTYARARENEKRHAPSLVERSRLVLGRAGVKLRCLIADSQYSSGRVRSLVESR
ncbi:MAG: hypothetical protein NTY03_00275 [Candidatus Bathyarchaeota archaeon]|nr:hypothetical protein [Candidatus Bathyarchaeota archaeon]